MRALDQGEEGEPLLLQFEEFLELGWIGNGIVGVDSVRRCLAVWIGGMRVDVLVIGVIV